MKQIILTVTPDGKTSVKGEGFVGKECDKPIAEITEALGKVTKSTKLPEYFQKVQHKQKVGGA